MPGEEKKDDISNTPRPTYYAEDMSTSSVCYAPAEWYSADWQNDGPKTGWYFLYGALANESKLAEVIGYENHPDLRPAKMLGYKLMLCGVHLVLTDGSSTEEVQGKAVLVELPLHARRLQGYMAKVLKAESCRIHLDGPDAEVVDGYAFFWDGIMSELRKLPAVQE
ncbi:predicted protein [Histoplasma capsulatum G186AR]|uniref:Gamma-glutamylcyclotransferase AIG2-like domain-containing protein n=2 Tax=Ajellomyces capsulatus TaxID=5037 RepID=C0NFZ7_AJECG|nr:uncharacterized protein HCBG_01813 [Histoplasma capsulatum G186AR]EEH10168.1 predicted protein [Histoplasma capsulatum G186AR]KAG5290880.1 hypothetical protein I7I52_08033 [Histoplasma capsulatum]QSS72807.1 hypothetical protein I7I50_00765 [Histoplasma capsulatum G186AR]